LSLWVETMTSTVDASWKLKESDVIVVIPSFRFATTAS
jgi:hypothetical protein